MKILLLMLLAGVILPGFSLQAQDKPDLAIRERAKNELDDALSRLLSGQALRDGERLALSARLRELETSVYAQREKMRELHDLREKSQQLREELNRENSDAEAEVNAMRNAFHRMSYEFEMKLPTSETELYSGILEEGRSYRMDEGTPPPTALVDALLERLTGQGGVIAYAGNAVTKSGEIVPGRYLAAGPFRYFVGGESPVCGVIFPDDSLLPHLSELSGAQTENIISYANNTGSVLPADGTNGEILRQTARKDSLIGHLIKGGVWIWPILASALVALLLGLVKSVQLFRIRMPARGQIHELLECRDQGDIGAATALSARLPRHAAGLMQLAFQHSEDSPELVEELLYEHLLGHQSALERGLSAIAMTAAIAPLLGLLGTVTGMIHTFQTLDLYGTGNPHVLAGGISEALITTEIGLVVAIPALVLHGLLSRRVHYILSSLEKLIVIYVNGLRSERGN